MGRDEERLRYRLVQAVELLVTQSQHWLKVFCGDDGGGGGNGVSSYFLLLFYVLTPRVEVADCLKNVSSVKLS